MLSLRKLDHLNEQVIKSVVGVPMLVSWKGHRWVAYIQEHPAVGYYVVPFTRSMSAIMVYDLDEMYLIMEIK